MKDRDDLFHRSARLDAEIAKTDPTGTINRLIKSGRRSRQLIRVVAVVAGLAILMAAFVIYGYFKVQDLSTRTAELARSTAILAQQVADNSESITAACEKRNIERAKQIALWDYIITISTATPRRDQTPADLEDQRQKTKAFNVRLREIFAPEKCPAPVQPTTIDEGA